MLEFAQGPLRRHLLQSSANVEGFVSLGDDGQVGL